MADEFHPGYAIDPERFTDLLQALIQDDPDTDSDLTLRGGVVVRWVLGVEVMTQGEVGTVLLGANKPSMRSWEALGMLEYLAAQERGVATRDGDG